MSIVRVGLAQTKKFAEGYEAIFGSKSPAAGNEQQAPRKRSAKPAKASAKKPPAKKKVKSKKK